MRKQYFCAGEKNLASQGQERERQTIFEKYREQRQFPYTSVTKMKSFIGEVSKDTRLLLIFVESCGRNS